MRCDVTRNVSDYDAMERNLTVAPVVVVVGNCGTGKTTVARRLAKELQVARFGIDESRRAVSDGTPLGEARAWVHLLEAAQQNADAGFVVELSGSGHLSLLLKIAMDASVHYRVIWLRASVATCLARVNGRPLDVPYPAFGVALTDLIPSLDKTLETEMPSGRIWPVNRVRCVNAEAPADEVAIHGLGFLSRNG